MKWKIQLKSGLNLLPEKICIQVLYRSIQVYAQQVAEKILEQKQASGVSIIMMNPQNGEIYAMVNAPEFNLNEPFTLNTSMSASEGTSNELLNQMWRNDCINDTYEPGSTFKIITSTAALEENVVSLSDTFSCRDFVLYRIGGFAAIRLPDMVQ